jgi:excisionase family DNA binding protein
MSDQIEKNKFYTISEAAKFLAVTAQTVSKYLRDGDLKGQKKGPKKKWFIMGDEIITKRKKWGYD